MRHVYLHADQIVDSDIYKVTHKRLPEDVVRAKTLDMLKHAGENHERVGRMRLELFVCEQGWDLQSADIMKFLASMKHEGLINLHFGAAGTSITAAGNDYLAAHAHRLNFVPDVVPGGEMGVSLEILRFLDAQKNEPPRTKTLPAIQAHLLKAEIILEHGQLWAILAELRQDGFITDGKHPISRRKAFNC